MANPPELNDPAEIETVLNMPSDKAARSEYDPAPAKNIDVVHVTPFVFTVADELAKIKLI